MFLVDFRLFSPLIRLTKGIKKNIIKIIIKASFSPKKERQMQIHDAYSQAVIKKSVKRRADSRSLYYRFMYAIRFSYRYFLLHSKTLRSGAARR